MKVTIKWQGPFSYKDLLNMLRSNEGQWNGVNKRGVYMHIEEKKWVSYIGKSESSVIKRNLQHISNILGLHWTIPNIYSWDQKEFVPQLFPCSDKEESEKNLWHKTYCDTLMDKERFVCRVEDAYKFIAEIGFYFGPIEFESPTLREVECCLLHEFDPLNTKATGIPPPNLIIVHEGIEEKYLKELKAATVGYAGSRAASNRPRRPVGK
jgi:hypothetical protein